MEISYETKYHIIERDNWWFKARRNLILNIINAGKDSKIIDIGCSGGLLLAELKSKGYNNVYGLDISKQAIEICKKSGLKNTFVGNALKTDFEDESFDVIIASDVLEHLNDDKKALSEWNRILRKNGKIILFVPAFQFLWSDHDVVNNHIKRYNKKDLIKLAESQNLNINRMSFWNFCLFLPSAINKIAKRLIKTAKKKDDFYSVNEKTNNMLYALLKFENKVIKSGMNFPMG